MMMQSPDYTQNNYSALEVGQFLYRTPIEPYQNQTEQAQIQTIAEERIQPTTTPKWTLESCSCVKFMRELGFRFPPIRTPADLKPNSTPIINGLVLFKFGKWDHIGKIIAWDIQGTGMFILHRYLSGEKCITTTSLLKWSEIRGVYKPSD